MNDIYVVKVYINNEGICMAKKARAWHRSKLELYHISSNKILIFARVVVHYILFLIRLTLCFVLFLSSPKDYVH